MGLEKLKGLRLGTARRGLLIRLFRQDGWQRVISPGTPKNSYSATYEAAWALVAAGLVERREVKYCLARGWTEVRLTDLGEEICGCYWRRLKSGAPMEWRRMRLTRQDEVRAA